MPTQATAFKKQVKARKQLLNKKVPPITHLLEIRWNQGAKKWVVSEPVAMVWRGLDKVKWTLVPDKGHPNVSAHFQFPDMRLFTDFGKQNRLSKDKTADILTPGGSLTLKVHRQACRRTNPHHYAVWISECFDMTRGAARNTGRTRRAVNGARGTYAVGQDLNPPPEITVGP